MKKLVIETISFFGTILFASIALAKNGLIDYGFFVSQSTQTTQMSIDTVLIWIVIVVIVIIQIGVVVFVKKTFTSLLDSLFDESN